MRRLRTNDAKSSLACIGLLLAVVAPAVSAGQDAGPSTTSETAGMIVDTEPPQLTLGVLESFALASNPSIQRAAALAGAARGRALQAGLSPNPEAGIDFQQLGSDGQAEQYGVAVRQQLVRRDKLRLNRAIELHEASRLEQELVAARQRVLTDVRIAYFRALRSDRQIELTGQLLELAEKGLNIANQLLSSQEVGRIDVLEAELEIESTSILARNAQHSRVAVWQELSSITAQPLRPQPLAGDLGDEVHEVLYEEALGRLQEQSPEIAAVLAEIQRAQCQLSREQIETRPDVTLGGLVNWRDNGIGGDPDGAVVVTLPIPVWNQNQGAIRAARHELTAAQRQLEQVSLSLQLRLAPVYLRYLNAREQVDRFEDRILPKSLETLQLTGQQYELGEISYINLLTAQRIHANSQLSYLDALESLRVAEVEIAGLLLSGSLTRD
jgi:cobalt-zinc-cadmium efflux system outer membrane protein